MGGCRTLHVAGSSERFPMSAATAPGVSYRAATDGDIGGQHAAFVAAESELLDRHGFGWATPPPVDALAPGFRHCLQHDADRCFVAESEGRVVGYSAAWVRGETWFLAGLFIDPTFQGRGVGRRLIGLAMAGAPRRRMTISDAIQPISNALYAKHGMLPMTPILGFQGTAAVDRPPDLVAVRAGRGGVRSTRRGRLRLRPRGRPRVLGDPGDPHAVASRREARCLLVPLAARQDRAARRAR